MRYFKLDTLGNLHEPGICIISSPPVGLGVKYYCMSRGKSISEFYPEDAKIFLKERYPGIKLASLIANTQNYLIVSKEVKECIETNTTGDIEYLPFTLYNHKKRVHSTDYFIINPLGTVDCLNFEASTIKYNNRRAIVSIKKMVLDSNKLTDSHTLFRVTEEPSSYIINEKLALEFSEKKFTNVFIEEVEVVAGNTPKERAEL